MQNRKNTNSSVAKRLAAAIVIDAAIFLAVSLIATAIAYLGDDPTGKLGIFALATLLVSGILGGFTVSGMKSRFGSSIGASSIGICTALYLAAALILSGKLGLQHLLNAVCYLGSGLLCSYLGRKRGKARPRRRA